MRTLYKILLGFIPLLLAMEGSAQTTISTTSSFSNNNSGGTVTFNLENANASGIIITEVKGLKASASNVLAEVWYKPTPINGLPGLISPANGWILIDTITVTGPASTTTPVTLFTNLNFTVPGNTTYGMAVFTPSQPYYTMPTSPATVTFTAGGVSLIAGANVSYGGGTPGASGSAPTFTPRGWIGELTFIPAVPPCDVPTAFSDVAFTTSANIGWMPSNSTNVGYEIIYDTSSTTPTGPGMPVPSTSVSLSGLTPNTTYYYFVRTVCGPNDYSAYVGDSFTTCNPPASSFIAVGSPFPASATICQGDTAILKAPGGAGNTYLYLLNGAVMGTGATSDSVLRTMQGGTYRVVVTTATGCYDTSAAAGVTVTVNPLPAPTIMLSGANELSTTPFSTYQWRLNGNPINLATQQMYTASVSGAYSVTVTDANGCRATSNPYNLVVTSVAGAPGVAAKVRIFPNPTSGRVTIESSVEVSAQLWTLDGRKIMDVDKATSIDLSNLAAGVYTLRLMGADGAVLATERLTKTN